jgi:hypothetical protein
MATYKVPQDVEAEDKLLGPLTLKQFIYAIIVFLGLWLTVVLARNAYTLFLVPLPLLPALFFAFMIFLGIKNPAQPAESYLAAIVRFYFKPHKRIWNQDGVVETVHITAPPQVRHQYANEITQVEVRSRLSQLSNVLDSRGWAAKDVRFQPNVVLPTQPATDDRLISLSQLPQAQTVEPTDLHASDDVMDDQANPVAQQFDDMLVKKQQAARDQAVAVMKDPSYDPYPAEMRQRVVQPLGEPADSPPSAAPQPAPSPPPPAPAAPDPALLNLAHNDTLSVATIASEAQRLKTLKSGDEISLH